MSAHLDRLGWSLLQDLQVAATPWRIRGERSGEPVVDTGDALLAWEPRRVTPVYAVPEAGFLLPLGPASAPRPLTEVELRRPVLDPSVPFAAHTAPGRIRTAQPATGPAVEIFAIDDPVLGGRLLVDFAALDWLEEDSAVVAHPHDPFHRIDVRQTRRHVVMTVDGTTVVDSTRARMLAETRLPVRWYVPREDVRVPLEPSATTSSCAYKGHASYFSARIGERLERDLGWTYRSALPDGRDVEGLLGFYAERMDVTVDDVPLAKRGMEPPRESRLA
jgi:uncharacterized protein (DUF427 family)